jgi:hypothetical protein
MFRPVRSQQNAQWIWSSPLCKIGIVLYVSVILKRMGTGNGTPEVLELPSAWGQSWATLSPGVINTER